MNELGPVEIRVASIEQVSYQERTISMIIAPYNEWADVEFRGQFIQESFAPGAFGAVRNRARKFTVNMEHDKTRWMGSVLDLDSANETGLRSRVKIRRTPEGDQALVDAADGLLGASIGFACTDADCTWTRGRRRINKAFLDHIALTATPAYVGAQVLEVRELVPELVPQSRTPFLDEIRRDGYCRALT
jgi:HK97 family phage prohead protease